MPSRFEPCGLNQMYSLRYGTVPVVRAVGGLADTVTATRPERPDATGFVFHEYTPPALLEALERALALYGNRPRVAGAAAWPECGRIIPGTVRPGSTSKYMNGPPRRRWWLRRLGARARNEERDETDGS